MGCGSSAPEAATAKPATSVAPGSSNASAPPAANGGGSAGQPSENKAGKGAAVPPQEPPRSTRSGPAMRAIEGQSFGSILINVYYPEDIASRSNVPLVVYQHGRGCTHHVYLSLFQMLCSLGNVVLFPYNENSAVQGEEPPWPSTALDESPDGMEMQLSLKAMSKWALEDATSIFYKRINLHNVALAGHSMGGKSSICAGAHISPKCIVLFSPSCSAEGSEVYNLSKEWVEDRFMGLSKDKTPILLLTNDEDVRQSSAESIYDSPLLDACPKIYLQFSKDACAKVHEGIVDHYAPPRTIFSREFMSSLPIDNNGFQAHCYLGSGGSQDPSLDWVGKFFGLYLIENGDTSSDTWKQLYAGGEGSIANDPMLSRFKVSLGN